MKSMKILRKLFKEQELKENLRKAHNRLLEELDKNDYRIAAFYSFDIAHIYELLGNKKKAKEYYNNTLRYLDQADFQPHWIKLGSFYALGKLEEGLKAELSERCPSKFWLAFFHDKMNNYESARQIYCNLAAKKFWNPDENEDFLYPHFLQEVSDLLAKAQNAQEARKYNQLAVKAWEGLTVLDFFLV